MAITKHVKIDGTKITDWGSFHDHFSYAMGFPGFYGRNMDAWIDCMSSLREPDDGMTSITVPKGCVLTLQLESVDEFYRRAPSIFDALIDCAAFVNHRLADKGEPSLISLSYNLSPGLRNNSN